MAAAGELATNENFIENFLQSLAAFLEVDDVLFSEHCAAEWTKLVCGAPLIVIGQFHLRDALAAVDVTAVLELDRVARDVEAYSAYKFSIDIDRIVWFVAFVKEAICVFRAFENWFSVRFY